MQEFITQREIPTNSTLFQSSPPISRLPAEILREIFMRVYKEFICGLETHRKSKRIMSPSARPHSRMIPPFVQTCNYWRLVALSMPRLWNEIELSLPMFALTCFERSKPLSISVMFNPTQTYLEQGQINPIFDGVFQDVLSRRAAQLGLMLREEDIDDVFRTLRDTRWEQLDCLTLCYGTPSNRREATIAPQPETLTGAWNWNVHNIALYTLSIPLDSSFFGQNLTSLTLVDCTDPGLTGNINLLQFLYAHPQLEELSIIHDKSKRHLLKIVEEDAPARITHEKLRKLTLWDVMDITTAKFLFNRFFTKASLKMSFCVENFPGYNPFPPEHPIAQRMHHLDTILVTLTSDQLQINGHANTHFGRFIYSLPKYKGNRRDRITIKLPALFHPFAGHPLSRFATAYGSPHCKNLIFIFWNFSFFDLDDGVDTVQNWTTLFESFPNLESIHIRLAQPAPAFEDLFIALAAFDAPNLKLQSISLEGVRDVEDCVEGYSRPLRKMHENGHGLKELRLLFRSRSEREGEAQLREEFHMRLKPWVGELQIKYRTCRAR